jgi:hypothetical protein
MSPLLLSPAKTLHRPRSRGGSVGFALGVQTRVLPPTHQCSKPQIDRLRRRAQLVREGVVTAWITLLLTSVAVAAPATLQQSPLTTIRSMQQVVLPFLGGSQPSALIDCP